MIDLTGVSTGFSSHVVSKGLELHIKTGEILSVVGPNGCGKTTLLKTAAGLLPPLAGKIRIDGKDIREFSRRELARTAAFLPQARPVPDITAEALVAHGRFPHLGFSRKLTAHDKERIERAMELTGAAAFRGKNVAALSGGERQRVYIAMTVAQSARVLFLDEPVTYLDLNCQIDILELVRKLNADGATIVMSLHDISAALSCSDRLCVMGKDRSICAVDTPDNIYASKLLQNLYNVNSTVFEEHGRKWYSFYRPYKTN